MTEKEKMIKGEIYDSSDPELVKDRRRAEELCYEINNSRSAEQRELLLKQLLGSTGKSAGVHPSFRCDYGWNIHAGENLYINYDCVFIDVCPIIIGSDCFIAPGVHIYTAAHALDFKNRNIQNGACMEYGKPVKIGSNVWICGRAVICPGVEIGDGSVIGAGAVVRENVPPNVLYADGRIIKELNKD